MVSQNKKENMFSKNMATINYWMREQKFLRYDSLFWDNVDGITHLYFQSNKPVAKVNWLCMISDKQEYFIPYFEFLGEYTWWNKNQASYWVFRKFEEILKE